MSIKLRVLVVDEDRDFARGLAAALRGIGCEPLLAGRGREAVRVARSARPDVVLVDPRLPDMTGYAAVAELRKDERTTRIPVLIWAAFAGALDGLAAQLAPKTASRPRLAALLSRTLDAAA